MPEKNADRFGRQGRTLLNKEVQTPDGPGTVKAICIFTDGPLTVEFPDGSRKEYPEAELRVIEATS